MAQQNVTVFVSNLPTGSIIAYCGTTIPDGWLPCDGSRIPAQYTALNQLLNSWYTPDLSGRTLIGVGSLEGNTYNLGNTDGEASHKLTVAEMPKHGHTLRNASDSGDTKDNSSNWQRNNIQGGLNNTSPNGGDQAHNNMQPYYAITYMIQAV